MDAVWTGVEPPSEAESKKPASQPGDDVHLLGVLRDAVRLAWLNLAPATAGILVAFAIWVLLALAGTVMQFALDGLWVSGWVATVLDWGDLAITIAQVAVLATLVAGLLQAAIHSSVTGRQAPLRAIIGPPLASLWLLLASVLAAVPMVLVAAVAFAPDTEPPRPQPLDRIAQLLANGVGNSTVDPIWQVVVLFALPAFAALVFTAPLIVDRGSNMFSAALGSVRLVAARLHLRDLPLALVSALGTVAVVVLTTWKVTVPVDAVGEDYWRRGTWAIIWVLEHFPWIRVSEIALVLGASGVCLVALTAAFYAQVREAGSGHPSTATTLPAAEAEKRTVAALAALAIASVLVIVTMSWTMADGVPVQLAVGQRIAMDNGLTVTVPAGWEGEMYTWRRYPAWLPLGQNAAGGIPDSAPGIGGRTEDVILSRVDERRPTVMLSSCFTDAAAILARAGRYPIAWTAPDGYATFRGSAEDGKLVTSCPFVVTRLPGKMTGVVWVWLPHDDKDRPTLALAEVWNELQIEGVTLPSKLRR